MPLDAAPALPSPTMGAAEVAGVLGASERTARRRMAEWYAARFPADGSPGDRDVPPVERVVPPREPGAPPPRPAYVVDARALMLWAATGSADLG